MIKNFIKTFKANYLSHKKNYILNSIFFNQNYVFFNTYSKSFIFTKILMSTIFTFNMIT